MPYSELYCHIVWATKNRAPILTGEQVVLAERTIRSACREKGVIVHAWGAMPDHVHLAISYSPSLMLSELIRVLQGGSSHLLNAKRLETGEPFAWQSEYGVLSFGKQALNDVVSYVVSQELRQGTNRIIKKLGRSTGIPDS